MKRLTIILVMLVLGSSIALSQKLNGAILPDYKLNDSTYVFSAAKVAAIMQLSINLNKYTNLLVSAEKEISTLRSSNLNGGLALDKLGSSNVNLLLTIKAKDDQILAIQDNLDIANKTIKTQNVKKTWSQIGLGGGLIGVGILAGLLIAK